jgi:uncharacterized protein YcaQ
MTCVTRVPDRSSPPAVLLRGSYRDGGKVKTRTLANFTDWSDAKIGALRQALKGETAIVSADALRIERSLPHGMGRRARHGEKARPLQTPAGVPVTAG